METKSRTTIGFWLIFSFVCLFCFMLPLSLGSQSRSLSPNLLAGQSATQLSDGRWLLVGGENLSGRINAASIWDPRTGVARQLPARMQHGRAWHTATVLPDGTIFIFGGVGAAGGVVQVAEIYNPDTQSFSVLPLEGLSGRARHTATLLTTGEVLIAGGVGANGQTLATVALWDSLDGSTSSLPTLATARRNHSAMLMPDGRILLWGGIDITGASINNGEVFDSTSERFTPVQSYPSSLFPQPTDAPILEDSLPLHESVDVPTDSIIALRFSKPLRANTVNAETVSLTSPSGLEQVKVVTAENGMLAFVLPSVSLRPGSNYTVSINGALDQTGLLLPLSGIAFSTQGEATAPAGAGSIPQEADAGPSKPVNDILRTPWNDNWKWNGERRNGRPRSKWEDLETLKDRPGVTALAGQTLQMNGEPLPNVTIRIQGKRGRTDQTGRFLIRNLEPGHHEMIIDGRTANTKTKAYGIFVPGVDLEPKQTNVLPFTIWMPELDTENIVTIPSPTTNDMVITTPRIPGLEVHIPAGTVIRDIDGKAATKIGISPLPMDRGPMPSPVGVEFPFLFTIQPGGSIVESVNGSIPGVRIILPNIPQYPQGAWAQLWRPDWTVGWFMYGLGRVSADGTQIIPDPGVVVDKLSCSSIGNPAGAPPPPKCKGDPKKCKDGDPVDLSSGLFVLEKTDLYLPDILPIELKRTYRQNDTISRPFGIGTTHPYEMFIVGDQTAFQFADLILPDGARVRYNRTSPGTSNTDAVMEHTSTQTAFFKSTLSWNVSRGGWDIKLKDGTVYEFIVYWQQELVVPQTIKDRNGNQLSITRDSNRRITRIDSPNNRWAQFTYDAGNRITQITDNTGRIVNYTYDASGRLWKVTDPNNGITEHTYDDTVPTDAMRKTRMLTIKDPRNIVFLTNEYDSNGRVTRQTQADTSVYQFAYTLDGSGNVTQTDVTDPRNNVRRVTFNADGEILTDKRALGKPEEQTTTYTLQAGTNLVLSKVDPLGRTTAYTYDTMGNITGITRLSGTPDAVTTTFTYESTFNQLTSVTDPLNHTTTFGYDAKGNLTSVTNALSQTTTIARNAEGQPISITDPLNNTTQLTYDFGDLASVTDPVGNVTNRLTDAAGRVVNITNPLGNPTVYDYDVLNRLTQVTDPLSGTTGFTHDPNGNLLTVTDARSNTTTYTYENMDRLATRKDPLLRTESYQYDLAGNMTQFTDRKSQVTNYTYDGLNRRTGVTYADASTTAYTYDNGNRRTQVVDSIAGTITRTYDGLNRLTSDSTPQGSVSYTYDAAGRRTSMTVAGQTAVNYTYDNANRLTQITQGSAVVSYAYDTAGRRTSLTLPNGNVMEYTYDAASRITEITYKQGSTVIGNLTYEYDKNGSRTKIGGTYARTGLPQAISSTAYNAANHQTTFGDKTLTYDNNGNLLTITDSSGTTTYTWNARNQLTGISGPGLSASFVYDGLGRREKKTINSNLTEFLFDGLNPVQETSGAAILANILPGLGIDEFLTRSDVPAGITSTLLSDALGSVIALTDATGAVQTEYTYEPFGKAGVTGTSNSNPYQYTGRENDGAGLYYYRARYYHPGLQRFISEDPIEFQSGDFNLYAYVINNPLAYLDPFGLVPGACRDPNIDCGPSGKEHWDPPPKPKSEQPPPVPPEPERKPPDPNAPWPLTPEGHPDTCPENAPSGCTYQGKPIKPGEKPRPRIRPWWY